MPDSNSPLLERLRALKEPIRVGIIGIGAMGRGLVYQCLATPGFRCVAVADIDTSKTLAFLESIGVPAREIDREVDLRPGHRGDEMAVMADGGLLATLPGIDVVIEASSSIREGGEYAVTALRHGKHLVLMNAEIDLIFGPALLDLARRNGVVCTSCDGDQHGVIKRLLGDVELWGFRIVMAGNMKGFLDRYSNPTKIVPEADKRKLDYRMCTGFTDGTKLNIEMALVANALGYRTHAPGMTGPRVQHVNDVPSHFDLQAMWEGGTPLVDYVLGARPDGGVFVVGYNEHPYQREMMAYYKMGPGPFYTFHRPYHLCHVEALQGVAEAVLDGRSLLQADRGFRTNVIAYAKTDLAAGDTLDGLGGYTCYGLIENCDADGTSDGLPICIADAIVLKRAVRRDERLTLSAIDLPPARTDIQLFKQAMSVRTADPV